MMFRSKLAFSLTLLGIIVPVTVCTAQNTTSEMKASIILRIDGDQHGLSRGGWVGTNAAGEIAAVLRGEEHQIWVFSSSGSLIHQLGRSGGGPGEFRILAGLGWLGDSLWVSDPGSRRVTVFGPDWKLAREIVWPTQLTVAPNLAGSVRGIPRLISIAMSAEIPGFMAMVLDLESDIPAVGRLGDVTHQPLLVRLSTSGAVEKAIGRVPGVFCWGSASTLSATRFCPVYRIGYSPSGAGFAVAGPVDGWPRDPSVRVTRISATGDTMFSTTFTVAAVPVPRAVRDSLAALPQPPGVMARPAIANEYPPVRSVVVGLDGRVWVEVQASSPDHRQFHVLSSGGRLSGRVRIPGRFQLWEARSDRITGVELGEDDVPSIVQYALN